MENGQHKAGYVVMILWDTVDSKSLKGELIALTKALEFVEGKTLNVYTNSKYAFGVLHAHGAIWREQGLLTTARGQIKHSPEIVQLLKAVQRPQAIAVMYCKAHQKSHHNIITGNRKSDLAAKEAAKRAPGDLKGMLVHRSKTSLNSSEYSIKEIQLVEKTEMYNMKRWMVGDPQ